MPKKNIQVVWVVSAPTSFLGAIRPCSSQVASFLGAADMNRVVAICLAALLASCSIEYESCRDGLARVGANDILLGQRDISDFNGDFCSDMPLTSYVDSDTSTKFSRACPGVCSDEVSRYSAAVGVASMQEGDFCGDPDPAVRSAYRELLSESLERIYSFEQDLIDCYLREAGVTLDSTGVYAE